MWPSEVGSSSSSKSVVGRSSSLTEESGSSCVSQHCRVGISSPFFFFLPFPFCVTGPTTGNKLAEGEEEEGNFNSADGYPVMF